MSLLSKILNYESSIFEELVEKRNIFINNLKKIETNNMNRDQLLFFIESLKGVTGSLKTSIHNIENFFEQNTSYSFDTVNFIKFYLLFGNLFEIKPDSELLTELTLESSDPDSEFNDSPDSDV